MTVLRRRFQPIIQKNITELHSIGILELFETYKISAVEVEQPNFALKYLPHNLFQKSVFVNFTM